MKVFIFVYGTLKKGFYNNFYLNSSKFISNAVTYERYQMYPVIGGEYPFIIKSEKMNFIKGEVYEVTEQETLDNLDILEGVPNLYIKDFILVELENGTVLDALTYFKNEKTNIDIIDKNKPMIEWK